MIVVCEHASNWIPEDLNGLGLDSDAHTSHIAWDIGALPVAKALSEEFDAPLIAPGVSRLVFDCNRPSGAPNAVLEKSESRKIPGNINLSTVDRQNRAALYYQPFHDALATSINRAVHAERPPVIISIHSFTPIYNGVRREFDLGILHDRDARLADAVFKIAGNDNQISARINEPYDAQDGVTFTLAKHAVPRGLLNVMIEIRNDLIEDTSSQKAMARRLSGYLNAAFDGLDEGRSVQT